MLVRKPKPIESVEDWTDAYLGSLVGLFSGPNSRVDPMAIRLATERNLKDGLYSETAFALFVELATKYAEATRGRLSDERIQATLLTLWTEFERFASPDSGISRAEQAGAVQELVGPFFASRFRGAQALLGLARRPASAPFLPLELELPGGMKLQARLEILGEFSHGLLARAISMAPPGAEQEYRSRALEIELIRDPLTRLIRSLGQLATACGDYLTWLRDRSPPEAS